MSIRTALLTGGILITANVMCVTLLQADDFSDEAVYLGTTSQFDAAKKQSAIKADKAIQNQDPIPPEKVETTTTQTTAAPLKASVGTNYTLDDDNGDTSINYYIRGYPLNHPSISVKRSPMKGVRPAKKDSVKKQLKDKRQ